MYLLEVLFIFEAKAEDADKLHTIRRPNKKCLICGLNLHNDHFDMFHTR